MQQRRPAAVVDGEVVEEGEAKGEVEEVVVGKVVEEGRGRGHLLLRMRRRRRQEVRMRCGCENHRNSRRDQYLWRHTGDLTSRTSVSNFRCYHLFFSFDVLKITI
jgi:hypothetical protein